MNRTQYDFHPRRCSVLGTALAISCLYLAPAWAQNESSVVLFGTVDINVARYSASGSSSVTRVASDGLSSTRWGIRGSVALGNGMRASFWLENGFSPDSGATGNTSTNNQSNGSTPGLFGRRATVSLTGDFGEFRLGRDLTPVAQNGGDFNLFGVNGTGKVASLFYPTFSSATHIRISNGINYLTPSIGGFYGQATYAPGENSSGNNGRYVGIRLGYRSGPFHVAGGTARISDTAGEQKHTAAGASYDMGVVAINMLYGRNQKGIVDHSALHAGITVPIGANALRFGYTAARIKGGDGAGQIIVGVIHNLSKRTALYVDGSQVNNHGTGKTFGLSDGFKPLTPGGKSTGFEAGIRHSF